MTEEEQLLENMKLWLRRFATRSRRLGKRFGLSVGLGLIALCGRGQGVGKLLAEAKAQGKTPTQLLAMMSDGFNTNTEIHKFVSREISGQIEYLAEEILYRRSDSLSKSIADLSNPRIKNREIRRNFKDAVGHSTLAAYCLATQIASDMRALKSLGLEDIIPQSLKSKSALCRAYVQDENVKPFSYTVPNTDEAIEACIREHNLSGGCLIFYPRDRKGNYHAVSLDMPEGDFNYNDSSYEILTSSANREWKQRKVNAGYFPYGNKAIIVDRLEFFKALLAKHLKGKTLIEQVACLYQGGAEEFVANLQRATGMPRNNTIALLNNTVKTARPAGEDNNSIAATFLFGMLCMSVRRKDNDEMLQALDDLDGKETVTEKIKYLGSEGDKKIAKAFSQDEYKQLIGVLMNRPKTDLNTVAMMANYLQQQYDQANGKDGKTVYWHEAAHWHEVANRTSSNEKVKTAPRSLAGKKVKSTRTVRGKSSSRV